MFYLNEDDGYTHVRYHSNKRPLKLAVYFIDSADRSEYLAEIFRFIVSEVNSPAHLKSMQPEKFWALTERISILFCKTYSPKASHGITKPEIRGAVYFLLKSALDAGEWPKWCPIGKTTFVQEAGGDYDE